MFVSLDDFQFQRHSFHQRNRIRLPGAGETWVSLPVDEVVAELGDRSNEWRAVVGLLRERPDLVALNAHVGVKPFALG